MIEGVDYPDIDFTKSLEVEAVIPEPRNQDILLREKALVRRKEVALRLHGLTINGTRTDTVCYRTLEQVDTPRFTRAWVGFFRRELATLYTEEAIEVDQRVAVFEGSRVEHMQAHRTDTGDIDEARVAGETPQQQLDVLDATDRILDLIEQASGA
jgi:hypothetical protein